MAFFLIFSLCDVWAVRSQNFPSEKYPNVLLPELTLKEEFLLLKKKYICICIY